MNYIQKVFIALAALGTATYSHASLVAYWNYNEGSGNVLYNTYGSDANDGVTTGATYVAGRPDAGTALDFSGGGGNYVVVADDNFAFGTGDFTISIWFKANTIADTDLSHKNMLSTYNGLGSSNGGYTVSLVRGGLSATGYLEFKVFGDSSSPVGILSDSALDDETWHNVVAVVGSGTLSMYIDGVLQSASSTYASNTIANPSQNLVIGRLREDSTVHNFDGDLDDTAIFSEALDQSQVTILYTQGPLALVPEPSNSAFLSGLALCVLMLWSRRRKS